MTEPLYQRDGDGYRPNPISVSVWNPAGQSGSSVGALLGHLIETIPSPEPMLTTRITIDYLRPAPMRTLCGETRILRNGRRMQALEAVLLDDGAPVARASAMRVRLLPGAPAAPMAGAYPPPDPEGRPLARRNPTLMGMETRLVVGGLTESGPGSLWGRPAGELVAGLPVSPFCGALMVADLGGVSNILDGRQWSFANIDLAVHFVRAPVSDWIFLDAQTHTAGLGTALMEATLADLDGPFGQAHQTVFLAAVRADA